MIVVSKLRYLERRIGVQKTLLSRINAEIDSKLTGADLSRYISGKAQPAGNKLKELWDLLLSDFFEELRFRTIISRHSHIIDIDGNMQIDVSYLLSDARALYSITDLAIYRSLKTMNGPSTVLFGQGITKVVTLEVDGIPFAAALAASMGQNVDMVYCRRTPTYDILEKAEWGQYLFTPSDGRLQGLFLPKKYIKENERVLIVDDVINSGISVRALIRLVKQLGGIPVAVLVLYSHLKDFSDLIREFPGVDFIVLYDQ